MNGKHTHLLVFSANMLTIKQKNQVE